GFGQGMLERLLPAVEMQKDTNRLPSFDSGFSLIQDVHRQTRLGLQLQGSGWQAIDDVTFSNPCDGPGRFREAAEDFVSKLSANVGRRRFPFLGMIRRMIGKSQQ